MKAQNRLAFHIGYQILPASLPLRIFSYGKWKELR
jgi:hypothetical protein